MCYLLRSMLFSCVVRSAVCVVRGDTVLWSPGDPRGFKVAFRFEAAVLPRTQGNNTGTLLAFIPQSNQKKIAQFIETTTIFHFPRLALTLKH
jgi:hypothetical protein